MIKIKKIKTVVEYNETNGESPSAMSHGARDLQFLMRSVANDVKNMTNLYGILKEKNYKNDRLRKIVQSVE